MPIIKGSRGRNGPASLFCIVFILFSRRPFMDIFSILVWEKYGFAVQALFLLHLYGRIIES